MIFSDGVHLISSESIDELHKYCNKINIKKCWFHNSKNKPHYDIPKLKRLNFFKNNPEVIIISSREIVKILNKLYLTKNVKTV